LLLLNGGVDFWEEHQASTAIAALKQRLARTAQVDRGGGWVTVAAAEVVPGDLVRVGRGEIVPADGRVVAGEGEADESALTGESLPVAKQPGDDAYSGSAISRGGPVVRVLATGASSVFGRTAELAGRRAPASHFQRAVVWIGKYLIALAVMLVAVIVLRGASVTHTVELALVVIIASIPVALPAVLSVTMAVGARYLAKREAVVSHLPAIEEMAGVDVLCADKTGTVTRNELAVADISPIAEAEHDDQVLLDAALTAERDGQDPSTTRSWRGWALADSTAGKWSSSRHSIPPASTPRRRCVVLTIRDSAPQRAPCKPSLASPTLTKVFATAYPRSLGNWPAAGNGRWPSRAATVTGGGSPGCSGCRTRLARTRTTP